MFDHYMLVVYDDYYVLVNMMFQWFSSFVTGNWIVVTDEAMMTLSLLYVWLFHLLRFLLL